MQSIFRLPWCSEQFAPAKTVERVGLESCGAATMVEIPMLAKLKRKLSETPEMVSPQAAPVLKRQRPAADPTHSGASPAPIVKPEYASADHATPLQTAPNMAPLGTTATMANSLGADRHRVCSSLSISTGPSSPPHLTTQQLPSRASVAMAESVGSKRSMTSLQQTIENEFNMQILMKHNELRLIEQELAKCQIALEQLRRCELRPYPGSDRPALAVSEGRGAALVPSPGFSRPTHPAPYGVTDGPYSRHYRQWLLHDPQFDSLSLQALAQAESQSDARSTRYSGLARKSVGKTIATPSSRRADSLGSIPNYPSAPPRDKSAPLVLRRSTDNQMVKLICNNCHRGNFSSIQGFLNHCRIAHKVDYKSHDLAAIDCGRVLDEHELANLPPESQTPAVVKPTVTRAHTAQVTSTPVRSNLVHPLNTNLEMPVGSSQPAPRTSAVPVRDLASTAASAAKSTVFKPSAQVPRLSQIFAKHNVGGDLDLAATSARHKIDLGHEDQWSPDDSQHSSPVALVPGARTITGASRAGMLTGSDESARPASRKGYRQPTSQRSRPSPLPLSHDMDLSASPHDCPSLMLSPHGADSNPGLVSDHEDDDHGSASEEDTPHTELPRTLSVGRHCTDNVDIEVEVDDEIDGHGVVIRRRNSLIAPEVRGICGAGSPPRKMNLAKGGR